jgi:hypothetical protein|tara:strand:- start:189 stop:503 length:315 start_codon:yes stop_codon:yes gene_type:complete
MENKVPKIHIDPNKILKEDIDKVLMSKYDIFYRRIVEFILERIENTNETNDELLAILVDDEGLEFEMELPKDGYIKCLGKALEYFLKIEEYETCDLIKQMNKQI